MQTRILNPNNGSLLFTMADLHDYANSVSDSSLNKYKAALIAELHKRKTPPAEIDQQVLELTGGMQFAACLYVSIGSGDQTVTASGFLIRSKEVPSSNVWDATIAVRLDAMDGGQPTFVMMTFPVITLIVDGGKNSPVILADHLHADRIAKIIGRGTNGRPWLRRVF